MFYTVRTANFPASNNRYTTPAADDSGYNTDPRALDSPTGPRARPDSPGGNNYPTQISWRRVAQKFDDIIAALKKKAQSFNLYTEDIKLALFMPLENLKTEFDRLLHKLYAENPNMSLDNDLEIKDAVDTICKSLEKIKQDFPKDKSIKPGLECITQMCARVERGLPSSKKELSSGLLSKIIKLRRLANLYISEDGSPPSHLPPELGKPVRAILHDINTMQWCKLDAQTQFCMADCLDRLQEALEREIGDEIGMEAVSLDTRENQNQILKSIAEIAEIDIYLNGKDWDKRGNKTEKAKEFLCQLIDKNEVEKILTVDADQQVERSAQIWIKKLDQMDPKEILYETHPKIWADTAYMLSCLCSAHGLHQTCWEHGIKSVFAYNDHENNHENVYASPLYIYMRHENVRSRGMENMGQPFEKLLEAIHNKKPLRNINALRELKCIEEALKDENDDTASNIRKRLERVCRELSDKKEYTLYTLEESEHYYVILNELTHDAAFYLSDPYVENYRLMSTMSVEDIKNKFTEATQKAQEIIHDLKDDLYKRLYLESITYNDNASDEPHRSFLEVSIGKYEGYLQSTRWEEQDMKLFLNSSVSHS